MKPVYEWLLVLILLVQYSFLLNWLNVTYLVGITVYPRVISYAVITEPIVLVGLAVWNEKYKVVSRPVLLLVLVLLAAVFLSEL